MVLSSPHKDWLKALNVSFRFDYINEVKDISGFTNIWKYTIDNLAKWDEIKHEIPSELKESNTYFRRILSQIDNFIYSYVKKDDYTINHLKNGWASVVKMVQLTNNKSLPFDHSDTNFLLKINKEYPRRFTGAFEYLIGKMGGNIQNRDYFAGAIMAYEFENKNISKIVSRSKQEKRSFNQIKKNFGNLLQEYEQEYLDHADKSNSLFQTKTLEIEALKKEKEELFDHWFTTSQEEFVAFDKTSREKTNELEKLYEEKLRLEKPAKYWRDRAGRLKKEGRIYVTVMITLILLVSASLYFLLFVTPEGMLVSFKKTGSAIKWSIVYIMFVSLMIYGIRMVHRLTFSSFHLSRDAEEREQLTYVYLALLKDNEIELEEKKLIIQALFSRADTGLLKEDSAPTMPNDFLGKLIK